MHRQAGKWYLTRQTFPELLQRNIQRYPDRPAQIWKGKDGSLQKLSFADLGGIVREIAGGLLGRGVQKEEPVAIVAPSIPQWLWADYAILCAGALTVAVSPGLSAGEMRRQLEDSGAKILFLHDTATLLSLLSDPPKALCEIIWLGDEKGMHFGNFRGTYLEAFREEGRSFLHKEALAYGERWRTVQPDTPMILVYAKDTGGRVRGILHTNASINHACIRDLAKLPLLTEKDVYLCVLPLSNLLERQAGHASAMLAAIPVAYASRRDFSAQSLEEDLRFFQPTYMVGVPFMCEKLLSRLEQRHLEAHEDFLPRKARALGLKILEGLRKRDGSISLAGELGNLAGMGAAQAAQYRLTDYTVYRKIRRRLGGAMRFIVCAGGILQEEAVMLFLALGIPVLQGYGPVEACHMVSLMPSDHIHPKSVGTFSKMVPHRLGKKKELLVRGDFLFKEYWKDASRPRLLSSRDYFSCGYEAEVSENGFVHVLEKEEDLIVLGTGEKVSPFRIEGFFALHPYFERVVAVGNGRPYPLLLILPDFTNLISVLKKEGVFFDEEDLTMAEDRVLRVPEEFLEIPDIAFLFHKEIHMINQQLAPCEKIGGMVLVRSPFSLKSGEMDENFAVNRRLLEERYKALIEAACTEKEPF